MSVAADTDRRLGAVILFGPPGSGKGTQAQLLVERTGCTHIAPGDILRAERAAGTVLGQRVAGYLDRGGLVPDSLIVELIAARLEAAPPRPDFVLDGVPRTVAQAEALDALLARRGLGPVRVVLLDVPEDRLRDRLRERALAQGRDDDTPETIATRMRVYAAETLPALAHYQRLGPVIRVDGTGSIDEVHRAMVAALVPSRQAAHGSGTAR